MKDLKSVLLSLQFAIPTGVGYINFDITSIPKKFTLKTGEKLLIQGMLGSMVCLSKIIRM